MRLAVVSPFVDRRHGAERALAELLERLVRTHQCEIHLYAHRVEDLDMDRAGPLDSEEQGVILWHRVPFIPGPHLLQFSSWVFLNSLYRLWDRFLHGIRFDLTFSPGINCLDADVIVVHAIFHRLAELAQKEAEMDQTQPGLLRRLHRRAYYAFLAGMERHVYSNSDVYLASVSDRTAELLASYFRRSDVSVIPNGVDTAQFSLVARLLRRAAARQRWTFQENDFVLLLIGNDLRIKGLPTILQAMAVLPGLPIHLVVGTGEAPDSFREMAQRLGVVNQCHFELPREEVLDFYAAADLYVSPSLEDSFGLPVAEAMACGLPVITSPLAGVSELVHDGVDGFVLRNPRDSQGLSQLFQRLRGDPDLRRRIGDAAAISALEWTWDRNAAAIWELLSEAAGRKK